MYKKICEKKSENFHPTAPYCILLHPTAPNCTLLYPTTSYYIPLQLHSAVSYCTPLHLIAPYCTQLHLTAPYYTLHPAPCIHPKVYLKDYLRISKTTLKIPRIAYRLFDVTTKRLFRITLVPIILVYPKFLLDCC